MDSNFEANVIELCDSHNRDHWRDDDYRSVVTIGADYFVKFGSRDDIWPIIETQQYIYNYARLNPHPDAPRIAQILHHFRHGILMYMVMEYIELVPTTSDLIDRQTAALVWLSSVPAPVDLIMGPVGGGPIRHRFFSMHKAPFTFSSVAALERYMARAQKMLTPWGRAAYPPVAISGDRLMFSQGDMDVSHFGVDQHGATVLLGFATVGFLPETLVALTMYPYERIMAALSLSTATLSSVSAIRATLGMVGDETLGLDVHGYPEGKDRRRRRRGMKQVST